MLAAPAAAAASPRPAARGVVDVIDVSGRIDPVLADFTVRALASAQAARHEALVIRLDSPGSLVSARRLDDLVSRIRRSTVPVAVWVGPTGAGVRGPAARLMEAAAVAGVAPGASAPRTIPVASRAPTLVAFVLGLDGMRVGERVLHTARATTSRDGRPRLEPDVQVRFAKLGLLARVLHTAASPPVAYFLLVAGLLLIVFEFFTAGVGVAGMVGAVALVLAAYGLAVLPTSLLGLALIVLGVAGFSIDAQTGAPRAWTVIGTVALAVGSARLYHSGISLPWVTLVLVVAGVLVFMLAGMAAMLRARFATPTIGRQSMLGEMGQATTAIDPEGTVSVRGALWRARTNRATPVAAGMPVRVVAVDGLLLEVEPPEGGARDAGH